MKMPLDSVIEVALVKFISGFADRLPVVDIENAVELIGKREWGVGVELLCAQIIEHEVELSAQEVLMLERIANAMNVDISGFGIGG